MSGEDTLTKHGFFGSYCFEFGRTIRPGVTTVYSAPPCPPDGPRPEDTVEHTVEVCPVWAEHRRDFLEAIGGSDLLRPVLVRAMVPRGKVEV